MRAMHNCVRRLIRYCKREQRTSESGITRLPSAPDRKACNYAGNNFVMNTDRRNGPRRVQFEPALNVRIMAIDGTWCRDCLLIDVSDSGAQLAVKGSGLSTEEFFLLLSSVGAPAFRRCKRAWVEGDRIGVWFEKKRLSGKLLKRSSRNWESTAA
jgi:hypothetical protein